MSWKKLVADIIKVVAGAVAGWLVGGCSFVPVIAW